jgi:hypothetical protein
LRRRPLVWVAGVLLSVVALPLSGATEAAAAPTSRPAVSLTPVRSADASPRHRAYVVRTVRPGDTFQDTVTATNLTSSPLPVVLDAVDASVTADGQFAPAAAGTHRAAGSWMTLPRRTLTLPPHGSARVPVRFRVPDDATDGDHLAAVTIQRRTADVVQGGIAVQVRVAVRVYLTVGAGGRAAFSIEDLSFTGTAEEPTLGVTVVSTGRRLVETAGSLRITRGTLGDTVPLPVLGTVPAGESRRFTIPIRGPLEAGNYTAALDLWVPDGSVKASARTEFGVGGSAGGATEAEPGWQSWVVPVTVGLLFLLLLLLWRRRRVRPCTDRDAHTALPTAAP